MRTDKGQICKNLADNDECRDCIFVLFSDGTLLHNQKYVNNCSEFNFAFTTRNGAGTAGRCHRNSVKDTTRRIRSFQLNLDPHLGMLR
jgi:hypothetical protein